jgi:hypothetical protein
MRTDYFINTVEFTETFPKFEIKDCTVEGGRLPMMWKIDRSIADDMNTLDMMFYNFLLDNTGIVPKDKSDVDSDEVATFIRIEASELAWLMNCGKDALRASIDRLKGQELLWVLHEVGKANAYLARV